MCKATVLLPLPQVIPAGMVDALFIGERMNVGRMFLQVRPTHAQCVNLARGFERGFR
jgi:hypothetical protein